MHGSSPLARGLHPGKIENYIVARIIPARAGFTSASPSPSSPIGDHPRSRGVYAAKAAIAHGASGSSPLARGLQQVAHGGGPVSRIIPARAGFTQMSGVRGGLGGDHPRSRGVYDAAADDAPAIAGSSPLARGLRGRLRRRDRKVGIIPARAGFTPVIRMMTRPSWDHPRSRGVYTASSTRATVRPGSSPLARGLPPVRPRRPRPRRIIPARAGFTPRPRRRTDQRPDHPRSRGVYGVDHLGGGAGLRIIPARAGFTSTTPSAS